MNIKIYEGKNEEELLKSALENLGVEKENILYFITSEKTGLLKKETFKLHLVTLEDVVKFVKEFLKNITKDMGLEVTMESKIRDEQITIKMYSDNNSILIGKEGQTLKALTTIVKQVVYNEIHSYPYILLDVENYKEKQENYLIRLARRVARDVEKSKVEVELDNMNSYERRIIHNELSNSKKVYTESVGVEPNRHIVVKPKEN